MRRRTVIKTLVGIVVLGVLGVLFVRSARSTRAEPYEIARDRLVRWTLAIDAMPSRPGALLELRPEADLAADLFRQVFLRAGESLHGPNPAAMPLVLEGELDGAAPGALTPDALLALARDSGLESTSFEPRCMAYRRVSEPGLTQAGVLRSVRIAGVRRVPKTTRAASVCWRFSYCIRSRRAVAGTDRRCLRCCFQHMAAPSAAGGRRLSGTNHRALRNRPGAGIRAMSRGPRTPLGRGRDVSPAGPRH